MGTILAAMTGIIGASVTMMTALALPTMMKQGYSHALSCGTIAAAGTLGILIPPSIMLIVMADLLSVSVGNLFSAAIIPGLTLAAMYLMFIFLAAKLKPSLAPPLPPDLLTVPKGKLLPAARSGRSSRRCSSSAPSSFRSCSAGRRRARRARSARAARSCSPRCGAGSTGR